MESILVKNRYERMAYSGRNQNYLIIELVGMHPHQTMVEIRGRYIHGKRRLSSISPLPDTLECDEKIV